ncbi:MAG TPA: porin [Nannocystaceae bacterium]|nr:porin [Nannocystaceae bacterium]
MRPLRSIPALCLAAVGLAAPSRAWSAPPEEPIASEPVEPPTPIEPTEPDPPVEPAPVVEPEPPPPTPPAPARVEAPVPHVDANAVAAAKPADPPSRLRPPGEVERMAERPLGSGSFKPGKGITWQTADKRFSVNLGVVTQWLYTFSDVHPRKPREQNTSQMFEIRRARFIIQGNVFTEHIKYYAQAQFSPRDLGIQDGKITQSPVFLWYTTFDRFRDFTPVVGVQWVPFSHQRTAPITKLQFVDFSLASQEFGLERDIGVQLMSNDIGGLGKLKYHAGVFMGEGVQFIKPTDVGMVYVGRLEVLPFGDFDDYPEVDFNRRLKPKLAISAGYAYDHGDRRNRPIGGAPGLGVPFADLGTTDAHNATADVIFKMAGFSFLGDFWFRHGKRHSGEAEDAMTGNDIAVELARNGIGGTAQAGFLIPRVPFEIAGRYSGVRPIGNATSLLALNEAGPALSYYFYEHSVKLQLDYHHGWGERNVRTDKLRLQLTVTF